MILMPLLIPLGAAYNQATKIFTRGIPTALEKLWTMDLRQALSEPFQSVSSGPEMVVLAHRLRQASASILPAPCPVFTVVCE
jgi:hypothetical protein